MKHLIEWLLATTGFAVGAYLSALLLDDYARLIPFIVGCSLGYGLHLITSIEEGKGGDQ